VLLRLLREILERRAGSPRGRQRAADALLDRALALAQGGDTPRAIGLCQEALAGHPLSARAHWLLGGWLARGGDVRAARPHLERAVELSPESPEMRVDLGNVRRLMSEPERALECYDAALRLRPGDVGALKNSAQVLGETGRTDEAVGRYRMLLGPPAVPSAVREVVTLLDGVDRTDEARAICEMVLDHEPEHAEAHSGIGFLLLKRVLDAEAALPHLRLADTRLPDDPDVRSNLGIALQDVGHMDEAMHAYEGALRIAPDHRAARFHRALARLALGDFDPAWPDYELRLLSDDRPKRDFRTPVWQGEDLAGKTLLAFAEQGLGDEIMFASCLRDAGRAAGHLVIDCDARLAPIFRRSFPAATVHAGSQFDPVDWLAAVPAIDYVIPVGSLPMRLGLTPGALPAGYLRADPALIEHYRARIAALGARTVIGLSWRGGTRRSRQGMRSIEPGSLMPVLHTPGAQCVNLQYGECEADLVLLRELGGTVHHWPEALADYDHTAALVCALDLVVSVCTAVIHLGGAMGRPVWVMAPFSAEWRYGCSGPRMAWYPSVTVFRQPRPRDWASVIAAVADGLRGFVSP